MTVMYFFPRFFLHSWNLINRIVYFSVAALKVKLMLRRPYNQLVAQGIMPRKFIFYILLSYF